MLPDTADSVVKLAGAIAVRAPYKLQNFTGETMRREHDYL